MAKKYPTATGDALLRAYNRAVKKLIKNQDITSTVQSAGFIMPKGAPKGEGYQVFVGVTQFSEEVLKEHPLSGGLIGG
jgi:hypothetical protein